MKVLITGGAGFIGSHLSEALLKRGDTVRILDNLSTGLCENVPDGCQLIQGDIRRRQDLFAAVSGCELVYHLAAMASVPRCEDAPELTHETNVLGTIRLLEVARPAQRVVIASSSSVYGPGKYPHTDEDCPLAPRSTYAASKAAMEQYASAAVAAGQDVVCLRPFNVYGPRQRPDSTYAAVIPKWIAAALGHQSLEVHGDGLQSRDFCYVTDAVQAFLLAGDVSRRLRGPFNVSGGKSITLRAMLAQLEELLGRQLPCHATERRAGDVRSSAACLAHARSGLGYVPGVPFQAGLKVTLESLRGVATAA